MTVEDDEGHKGNSRDEKQRTYLLRRTGHSQRLKDWMRNLGETYVAISSVEAIVADRAAMSDEGLTASLTIALRRISRDGVKKEGN